MYLNDYFYAASLYEKDADLLPEAEKLMKEISAKAPIRIKYNKYLVNNGLNKTLADALDYESVRAGKGSPDRTLFLIDPVTRVLCLVFRFFRAADFFRSSRTL
jgi:enoyl-CoA hydratase/carnithine racemase